MPSFKTGAKETGLILTRKHETYELIANLLTATTDTS